MSPHNCHEILSPSTGGDDESKEFQRVSEGKCGRRERSVREASRLLHLSERQVQRLKRRSSPDSLGGTTRQSRSLHALGRSVPQKHCNPTLARARMRAFTILISRKNFVAEEVLALSRYTVRRILRAAKHTSPQKRRPRMYRFATPAPSAFRHDGAHRWPAVHTGSKAAARAYLIGLSGRRHRQILAAHFHSKPKYRGLSARLHALIHHPRHSPQLYRDRHAIFPAHDSPVRSPNSSPENNRPRNSTLPGEPGCPANPRLLSPSQIRIERACAPARTACQELLLSAAFNLEQPTLSPASSSAPITPALRPSRRDAACDFPPLALASSIWPLPQLGTTTRSQRRRTPSPWLACHRPCPRCPAIALAG